MARIDSLLEQAAIHHEKLQEAADEAAEAVAYLTMDSESAHMHWESLRDIQQHRRRVLQESLRRVPDE